MANDMMTQGGAAAHLDLVVGKYSSLVYLVNGRSVLWSVKIRSEQALENVQLKISCTPSYTSPQQFWITRMEPGEVYTFTPGCPEFDEKALRELHDDEAGVVRVELRDSDDTLLTAAEDNFTWLAYNAWAGGLEFPELLAALVLPYDPAIEGIIQRVAKRMHHSESDWLGYDDAPQAIHATLQALWDTLLQDGIDYKLPPTDGTRDLCVGQRVRTPSIIFEKGYSTCLDTSLLIAACLTRMRLSPNIILTSEHAFLCVALRRCPLPMPCGAPVATVRNLVEHGDLIAIETTFVNQGLSFEEACLCGRHTLNAIADEDRFEALDVEQIWHELGIHPILGSCPPVNDSGTRHADTGESLISTRPRTRLESWQRKLLDLSLRNNMLNTHTGSKYLIPLYTPGVAELEDALAQGTGYRIKPLPETAWTDATKAQACDDSDMALKRLTEGAEAMFRKRELLSPLQPGTLQRSLHAIYTASKREMEESGANTLFIACGFLKWLPKDATAPLQAPLLLLPVRLNRQSVRDGFTLSGIDEDAHINHTLLELLKTEFSLSIPELEGELPKDDSGLDVPLIFNTVRTAIRSQVGWEVVESCMLGIFSFAKYLMWRDLVERREQLLQNPVVRQLAADDREQFPEQAGFPALNSLDHEVDAHKVYTPLPADSSQLAAILAAARGMSFVLEGPPGTGKSQTIANMIAHCLGHGKSVLFVAEKAVALEVVHKRLERIGLGDFCLELHSNKTLASSVMQQFRDAVARVSDQPQRDEWDENVQVMTSLRNELNILPQEMHSERPDGESLYAAVCRLAAEGTLTLAAPPTRPGENAAELSKERRKELLRCARELSLHHGLLQGAEAAVEDIRATTASPAWESELQTALQELIEIAGELENATTALAERLGLPPSQAGMWRPVLQAVMNPLCRGEDCSALLPHCAGKALSALQKSLSAAQEYRRLRDTLSLPYTAATPDAPELAEWLDDCKKALTLPWPLKWLGMRRIRKILQLHANGSAQTPDCLHDLQVLVAMQNLKHQITQQEQLLPGFLRHGTDTQEHHLHSARQIAAQLEQACGEHDDAAESLLISLAENSNDTRVQRRMESCQAALSRLQIVEEKLAQLHVAPERAREACAAGTGQQWAENLLTCRSGWRDITLWNKKADEARELGVSAWVEALLRGEIEPAQLESAAAAALSGSKLCAAATQIPTLRDFAPLLHEEKIRDFAAEDKDLRTKTSLHIRNLLTRRAADISQHRRETAVLQREISKKRMHMPLRRLLASTPHITPLLKPCFLMSPLSVAQYLTDEIPPFDVVIFDEASQIPVWDAIGAIGRGKSVIITGDSRQMPPTSFFSRNRAEETDDDCEPDLESILDECLACGIPKMSLTWHYRSKSESLIAFSNTHYYEGKMTTFPAPALRDTALQHHYVGGVYESGPSRRVNPQEARAVVEHVLATLRAPGFRYTEATSIGIVTFNAQQQKLITDMLEDAREEDAGLEPFFAEENPEAVFVKNLENVQGDERGVIYFSTTYGRDAGGRLSMNFGPLNLTGGERRLNVAVTRARYAMHVFTSLQPEEIDLSRTRARGAADLRAFLEYARGGAALFGSGAFSSTTRDTLAQCIANHLAEHGYRCRIGMGASDYRVDIAVEHPEEHNAVLAGITLDGPAYRAAHTARDRDIVRPETMNLLGWRMINVWAIDWWRSPEKCLQTLLSKLKKVSMMGPVQADKLPDLATPAPAAETPPPAPEPPRPAPQSRMQPAEEYTAYATAEPLPPLFEMSDRSIAGLMLDIATVESPIAEQRLYERLFKAAPIPTSRNSRAGKAQVAAVGQRLSSILNRLCEHGMLIAQVENHTTADEGSLRVLRLPGAPAVRPRTLGPRDISHVPPSELREIARLVQTTLHCLPASDDHLRGICDMLNIRMLKKYKDFLLNMQGS